MKYIHITFNPNIENASEVIKRTTSDCPTLIFESLKYLNDYEAVCIFSDMMDVVNYPTIKKDPPPINWYSNTNPSTTND